MGTRGQRSGNGTESANTKGQRVKYTMPWRDDRPPEPKPRNTCITCGTELLPGFLYCGQDDPHEYDYDYEYGEGA